MKILLINHFPLTGSGSGVYTQNIANSLLKKGHELCIVIPENKEIENIDENIKIFPVYFQTELLPFNFPCFTTHPRSQKKFSELNKEEIKLYIESFNKVIKEAIDTFKPDIIHIGHIWILPYLVSKYNIPFVITAHGTDLIGYQEIPYFRKYCDIAVNKTNNIICVSKENEILLNTIFPNQKNKITFIPNGYNIDWFYPKNINKNKFLKQFNINNHYDKIVCFVGKFTKIKGIDILLKAAKIYEKENILTILAGDGELMEEMKQLANSLQLKNIFFIKNQPHQILNELYNIADVSIVCSRSEAFGLVAIEALACGTPVIASNIGGLTDIVNEKVGFLFESENEIDLANKINLILNKKVIFDKTIISKYAKKNFSQDQYTEQLINIYNKCVKK